MGLWEGKFRKLLRIYFFPTWNCVISFGGEQEEKDSNQNSFNAMNSTVFIAF